jgi:hypothetical protein
LCFNTTISCSLWGAAAIRAILQHFRFKQQGCTVIQLLFSETAFQYFKERIPLNWKLPNEK